MDMIVIDGVQGKTLKLPHIDYSEKEYRARHGKKTNLSELGCYFSHIKALKVFLESDDDHALILEDDVSFLASIVPLLDAAVRHQGMWDILRLSGLHRGTPVKIADLGQGFRLCCNLSRQTGSGAYVVNRKAAARMLKHLVPMKLPYDHAFDREWTFGAKAMCIIPFPVNQKNNFKSQISTHKGYKLSFFRRYLTVFPYRFYNECSRGISRSYFIFHAKKIGRAAGAGQGDPCYKITSGG